MMLDRAWRGWQRGGLFVGGGIRQARQHKRLAPLDTGAAHAAVDAPALVAGPCLGKIHAQLGTSPRNRRLFHFYLATDCCQFLFWKY